MNECEIFSQDILPDKSLSITKYIDILCVELLASNQRLRNDKVFPFGLVHAIAFLIFFSFAYQQQQIVN